MKNANQTPSANQMPSANQTPCANQTASTFFDEIRRAAKRSDLAAGSARRTGSSAGSSGVERFDRPVYTTADTSQKTTQAQRSGTAERTDNPKRKTGCLVPVLLLLLIAALLYALFGRGGKDTAAEHVHDYYLAEFQEATETANGHRTFVCSGCGDSYDEVIPRLIVEETPQVSETSEPAEDDLTASEPAESNDTPLKDMFVFDKLGRENSYIIDYFSFDDDTVTDSYGNSYHGYHELISYGGSNSVSSWAILLTNGEYTRFTGTIFAEPDMSSSFSIQFLVFVDGTQVYDSGFLTRNDPAVSFDIDVAGAQQVKVQAYSSDYSFYDVNPRIYLVDAAFHRQ